MTDITSTDLAALSASFPAIETLARKLLFSWVLLVDQTVVTNQRIIRVI